MSRCQAHDGAMSQTPFSGSSYSWIIWFWRSVQGDLCPGTTIMLSISTISRGNTVGHLNLLCSISFLLSEILKCLLKSLSRFSAVDSNWIIWRKHRHIGRGFNSKFGLLITSCLCHIWAGMWNFARVPVIPILREINWSVSKSYLIRESWHCTGMWENETVVMSKYPAPLLGYNWWRLNQCNICALFQHFES